MAEEKEVNQIEEEKTPSATEILEVSKAILQANKEIAESLKYLKNHFRLELVITAVKWIFVIALLVFGFISISSLLSHFGGEYLSEVLENIK